MSYQGRIRVSFGDRITSLGRLRAVDERYADFVSQLGAAERMWEAAPNKDADALRDACTVVVAQVVGFAKDIGIPEYAVLRLNDLLVALGELHHGRKSSLLTPAPVHPGSFSASDLAQQGIAQLSVDLLREAGFSAGDARKKVASIFARHRLPKFSEAKLRTLQGRLTGPGSNQDEAYDFYRWAGDLVDSQLRMRGLSRPLSTNAATKFVTEIVRLAKDRDHRRDFFFAPREDSSEIP